ncbi:MAG: 2-amino-4-hydroxy-6-hydroxymethyldihydropteridine diphosphokinase [Gammaproteobacteria bacterium]|uniref:2-amino-4-hydroxy-6- hydroxymethyldihydropteridine diphosphokinase n=1 Tax=Limnobacter sp. TaxID=2003368 RepID=UPI001D5444C3|nr:2-amino-4-hydroxy-6-hydroxymethyldihydropteridine diphosphokinase [Limnobacter sp.]MBU0784005.1 2-amino-4-hydroxy-6-hydroxymethyldihydropteridine diphosphokinase [Gammaproteobacteria bacterium]MBU0848901.1 2-amino-4-hydroxy-6-hydroxymethyldihydropteridine diphosphokinase [Gammaproteobacteria bacterium]MBU1267235.1 2-amino-4-hydroxy-6-hydroxymethyldihydropteridine diphosphokinase [Gammaproteobacteria bacterium]MBU1527843.1 2-amino-4-hydroxy-6-hydroxymethyldihydropteridine diphosphokinase [Gam
MNGPSNGTPCYLGLGGNLGHPMALFDEVVQYFQQHPLARNVKESPRYESAPVDATGPNYVNSVLEIQWLGGAEELLKACLGLETQLGRVRTTRNAPRPIDVDVLLFGLQTVNTQALTVPHPRMHLRRFVLEPLLQLNPNVQIPALGFARNYLPATQDQIVKAI